MRLIRYIYWISMILHTKKEVESRYFCFISIVTKSNPFLDDKANNYKIPYIQAKDWSCTKMCKKYNAEFVQYLGKIFEK